MNLEPNSKGIVKISLLYPELRKTFGEEQTLKEGQLSQEDLLIHTQPWSWSENGLE